MAPFLDVVVGLGSNLGDRRRTLDVAVERVGSLHATRVIATSGWAETAPVGDVEQGPFLNGAARLHTALAPRALMDALLRIEASMGRVRRARWGPRTLDLDVLWIDGVVVTEAELTVPHPRLLEREFALAPLLEVAPDARDPRSGRRYLETYAARFSGRSWADAGPPEERS